MNASDPDYPTIIRIGVQQFLRHV